jgi:cytochrome c oxidase subunit 2
MAFDPGRRTLLGAAAAMALASAAALVSATPKPKTRAIKVVARKFEFIPGEIHVRQGESVVFQLTAPEVPMGFNLADFGVRTDIVPGKVATVELTPDRAGTFTFLCDVFCGSGHEDMNGVLIVS